MQAQLGSSQGVANLGFFLVDGLLLFLNRVLQASECSSTPYQICKTEQASKENPFLAICPSASAAEPSKFGKLNQF